MYFKNSATESDLNEIWNNEVVAPQQAIVHLLQYHPNVNPSDVSQLMTRYCKGIIEIVNNIANYYSIVRDKNYVRNYLLETINTIIKELSEFLEDYRINLLLATDYTSIEMLMALKTNLNQLNPRKPEPIDFSNLSIQQDVDCKVDDLPVETPLNSFFPGNTFDPVDSVPQPQFGQNTLLFFRPMEYGRSEFVEQIRLFSNPPVGLDRDVLKSENYDETLRDTDSLDDEFERFLGQL